MLALTHMSRKNVFMCSGGSRCRYQAIKQREPKPWKMGDSAPEYIDGMLKAIVGIEISIARMEGKAKLSQNREDRDRLNAAEVLASHGEVELSQAMRKAK
jgi:predicted FMN-binding regulatory protein PaiB